jgi:hypothetical protein
VGEEGGTVILRSRAKRGVSKDRNERGTSFETPRKMRGSSG